MTRQIDVGTCELITEFSGERLFPWLETEADPMNPLNQHEIKVFAPGFNRYAGSDTGDSVPAGPFSTVEEARDACEVASGYTFQWYAGYGLAWNNDPAYNLRGSDYFGITNIMPDFRGWVREADGLKRDPIRIVYQFVPHPWNAVYTFPVWGIGTDYYRRVFIEYCTEGGYSLLANGPYAGQSFQCGGPGNFEGMTNSDVQDNSGLRAEYWARVMNLRRVPGTPDRWPRTYDAVKLVGGCGISVRRIPRPPIDDDDWFDLPEYELDSNYRYDSPTTVVTQPTAWVYQSATNYRVLQRYDTGYYTEVVRYPLNPAVRQGEPDYNNRAFWDAEYQKAKDAGTMKEGLVYGSTYGVVQSHGWYRTYTRCSLIGIPLTNFPCQDPLNSSTNNVLAINDSSCRGDEAVTLVMFDDELVRPVSLLRGAPPPDDGGGGGGGTTPTPPDDSGELICVPNPPESTTCIGGDEETHPPCDRDT